MSMYCGQRRETSINFVTNLIEHRNKRKTFLQFSQKHMPNYSLHVDFGLNI